MSDQAEGVEAVEGKRVSIWLPGELRAAMAEWSAEHGPLNLSAICQPAIRAAIGAPNETEALAEAVSRLEMTVRDHEGEVLSTRRRLNDYGKELARLKRQLDALHKLIADRSI